MKRSIISGLTLLATAMAQQAGTLETETHPKITWQNCSSSGCQTVNAAVVIDSNWRWAHDVGGYENCFEGNEWTGVCNGDDDCAKNCEIEGANYQQTYGVSTSGDALTLRFVTEHEYGSNIGSRTYLMNGDSKYQMFTLMDNEIAFDVDLSKVPCGMNSALYLVPMEEDGGMASQPNNNAGAKYGTGYCDAQCARDLKWVGGVGNHDGWQPSATDENAGVGRLGSCCAEIDIWESNRESFAFTPHACSDNFYHVCESTNCGGTYSENRYAGKCDANGCDYNPYRLGNHNFYGSGSGNTINTDSKFTVISRFEQDRAYQVFIQNGQVINPPAPNLPGLTHFDAEITPEFCEEYPVIFQDRDRHGEIGGHTQLNAALRMPMVLVLSIWADHNSNMLWLDSLYPPEKEGIPGALRGRCPQTGRTPADVIRNHPDAAVTWSNIRFGPIGTTHNTSGGSPPPTSPPPTSPPPTNPPPTNPPPTNPPPTNPPPGGNCAGMWGQCGGQGWSGPTCCSQGSCQEQNPWYSQCL
ncbi:carbohydrate-binding module family 1 protein [Sodiomyces alcalophilus JCM 7366]|uniref:carbohydrate-binding module family 1 protein n=1 Tax=Sodiomyces alcalophilus JCM 7366 TaxID=591952 RepID=UPI0039B5D288